MSKFTKIVNSFKTGKVSKKLAHRQDVEQLKDSCTEIDNFTVQPSGGVKRRYGTNRLNVGTENTYPDYNDGNFYHIKYTKEHNYVVMLDNTSVNMFDTMTRDGVTGVTSKFVRVFDYSGAEKRVITSLTMQSAYNAYAVSTYAAWDNTKATPFAQLPSSGWHFAQTGRKTIFAHTSGNYAPFVIDTIISTGTVIFTISPWHLDLEIASRSSTSAVTDGPGVAFGGLTIPMGSLTTNANSVATMTVGTGSYTAGLITISAGGGDLKMIKSIDITNFFYDVPASYTAPIQSYVGSQILLLNGATQHGLYTVVTCAQVAATKTARFTVVCTCESTAGNFSATAWAFSDWGGPNGFPRSVTSYRGKVVFGGNLGYPNRIWVSSTNANNPLSFQTLLPYKLTQDSASDVSGFLYHTSAVTTDLALALSFNEGNSGEIRWIKGRKVLHLGTNIGEYQISFLNNVFSLANMEVAKVSSYASSNIQPAEGDQKIFYVANSGTDIRYISTKDKFSESVDVSLSILNREYTGIDKLEWSEEQSLLLFRTTSKEVHSVTVHEQSGVTAFNEYTFPFDIHSFTVLDKTLDNSDGNTAYLLIKYNSVFYQCLMRFDGIDISSISQDKHHLDFAVVTTGTVNGTNTYTALKYANLTVGYYVNDVYATATANGSGVFSVLNETIGSTVIYGIPMVSSLTTAPVEEGSKYGSSNGLIKRVDRATIYLTKSGKFKIGGTDGTQFTVEKTTSTFDDYNEVVEFSNNSDYEVKCVISSVDGHPVNISSVAFRGVTYEGE